MSDAEVLQNEFCLFFFFLLFGAAPAAYEVAGSIKFVYWLLIRFVSAVPQWELQNDFFSFAF